VIRTKRRGLTLTWPLRLGIVVMATMMQGTAVSAYRIVVMSPQRGLITTNA